MSRPLLIQDLTRCPRLREELVASEGLRGVPGGPDRGLAVWARGAGRRVGDDGSVPFEMREQLARALLPDSRALELGPGGSAPSRRHGQGGAARRATAQRLESVLIPEEGRTTLCVSTQVGCPLACSFCATGAWASRATSAPPRSSIRCAACERPAASRSRASPTWSSWAWASRCSTCPLVTEAIRLLIHPKAFGMAPRRVTVSTVGVLPQHRSRCSRAGPDSTWRVAARHHRRGARRAGAAQPPLPPGGAAAAPARQLPHGQPGGGRSSSSTR